MKIEIENYKPMIVLLKYILNPGMKQKHWNNLAQETGKLTCFIEFVVLRNKYF